MVLVVQMEPGYLSPGQDSHKGCYTCPPDRMLHFCLVVTIVASHLLLTGEFGQLLHSLAPSGYSLKER